MESLIFSVLPVSDVIETERLMLKEVNPKVSDFIFTRLKDNEIKACYALDYDDKLKIEKEKWEKGLTTYNISFRNFLLFSKISKEVIGRAGFHTWQIHHHRAEIGYGIDKAEQLNKGYMGEALAAIIPYGFEQMELNRIEAFLSPHNTPSVKLMERFGFVKEGSLREHYFKNGIHEDSDCYSILRREFDAKPALFETIR